MSTAAQIVANRLNAQLSTGPRTPEGKAASSANSRKEGFTATTLVVPEPQRAEFERYHQALIAEVQPQGAIESELFDRLLVHGWSLRRVRAAEAQIIIEFGPEIEDEVVDKRLKRLARYRRDLERSYDRAFKELVRLQTLRAALEEQAIAPLADLTQRIRQNEPDSPSASLKQGQALASLFTAQPPAAAQML